MSSSNETLLATIEAEREIYRTFLRFFRLVDTRQFERLGEECFTPDAVIEYHLPAPHRFNGRAEFTAYMLDGPRRRQQMVAHVLGQIAIEWEAGRPSVSAYATVWHWYQANASQGDLRPADWTTIGLVEDDFEQFEGRWLIARRTVSPITGLVAAGSPPLPTAARPAAE
ncbi:nuclear transport factor 2 family protein [Nonomuraea zeae]|uniref:Nuclear transport factor 2 family protein n=2 Tax=Nonomuraea zeae TaxID=1642303 RepID=A0A5S4GKA1_9ACTN|nr:nuclear transport factor 2 family protein [Nonomuraea zeae]